MPEFVCMPLIREKMLLTFATILVVSTRLAVDSASIRLAEKTCQYDGVRHPLGSKFNPNPCTSCHCSPSGQVNCVTQDCLLEQHCLTFSNSTAQCCPSCLETGCRHSDGRLYRQGEVIRNEACVRCYCPVGGGNPVCDVTSCPSSHCVDPIEVAGVCCPICPNGPNCQIGLLTLPIGQSVEVEGATCACESFTDADGNSRTLARCNKN